MNKLIGYSFGFIFLFCFSACKTSTNQLSGKWTSLAEPKTVYLVVDFKDDNSFTAEAKDSHASELIEGKYAVHDDSLFIRDTINNPMLLCNYGDTGSYIFLEHQDTIFFKTLKDGCERRKLTFEIGFVKIK